MDEVLATWWRELEAKKVPRRLRFNSDVTSVTRADGRFRVELAGGGAVEGDNVLLAMGTQGNITKLAVPGAERVRYQLADPADYRDKQIVVVGAGDTAIENAIALAARNRVTLVVRGREFKPEKVTVANLAAIEGAIRAGSVQCRFNAQPVRVEPDRIVLSAVGAEDSVACDEVIARIGSVKPRKFLEACGVRFDSDDENADPRVDNRYCSDVEGLYRRRRARRLSAHQALPQPGLRGGRAYPPRRVVPADRPRARGDARRHRRPHQHRARAAADRRHRAAVLGRQPAHSRRRAARQHSGARKAAGEPIIRRGEYGNSIFAICEGEVAVEIDARRPRARTASCNAGDFFGEMGLDLGPAALGHGARARRLHPDRGAAPRRAQAPQRRCPTAKSRMDETLIVAPAPRLCRARIWAAAISRSWRRRARPVTFAFGDTIIEPGQGAEDVST